MFKNKTKCAVDIRGKNKICSKPDNITMLKNYLHTTGLTCKCLDSLSEEDVIKILKKKFNLTHEYEIYKEDDIKRALGNKTKDILNVLFVNKGPNDSTALLSNFDIDNLCKKWMDNSEQFNKKYYHIQFQMIDFLDYPNKLRDLNIPNLIKNKYDCFSCVLNTDISTGRGKHWFCIYGDMNNIDKNGEKKIVLEHFNSSGMPIRLPVLKWLENTVTDLKLKQVNAKHIYANKNHQLQYSDTECGVWSLIYIISRLFDKKNDWMIKNNIKDSEITKYRDYLFR